MASWSKGITMGTIDIAEEWKRVKREATDRLKRNFMYQLLAVIDTGGRTVRALKAGAVQQGICRDVFNISDAVNELVREELVTIEFIGGDPYLWLTKKGKEWR